MIKIKKTPLICSFLLVSLTLASGLPLAEAKSPATPAATRMKAWEDHMRLEKESIFKDVKWTAVGPRIQGGKIESIWIPKKQKNTIYAGVGSGNLWKSETNGTTWKPVFEKQATCSVAVVTVCDKDPNLVWVGTGEPHMARSSFAGTGVYKSTDGAKTWKHMGLVETHHINRVLIDPKDSNVVYVAALGHQYTYNKERGLFKTTDGGKTWTKSLYISEKVGVVGLAIDPSDSKILYATAWERDRKAWHHIGAGPGSALYKTTDAGKTWRKITKGLPTGKDVGRMCVSVSPSNPKVVYVLAAYKGGKVYRSDDKGESWRKTHEGNVPTGIGYDFCIIRVCPDDENQVFVPGFNLVYSADGGKTWTSRSKRIIPMLSYKPRRATPHCDNHDIFIDPDNPDRVLLGTDGGLYMSYDRAQTWLHLNRIPIAEFYAISVDMAKPYRIWGGTQDNGALGGEARPMNPGQEHWRWWDWGDQYVTRVDPNDKNIVYFEGMFGGGWRRVNIAGGKGGGGGRPGAPPGIGRMRTNWMTPYILSPHDSKTIYYGANFLSKSTNRGDSWKCISPDLTTKPGPEKQGNVPYGTITDVSESPIKKGLLYVGTDDAQVHVSKDDGKSWTKITKGLPERWVTRVVASKYDVGTVFVSHTGYRKDDFEKYLHMSTDYGQNWKSIANNMPSEAINVIREDPFDKDILYVGTELGIYCSIDRGKKWHSLTNHLPTCAVHDIAVHPREGDLVIGTHGRSAFVLDAKKIREIKKNGGKPLPKDKKKK